MQSDLAEGETMQPPHPPVFFLGGGGGNRSYKPLSNLEVSRARPNNEHLCKTKTPPSCPPLTDRCCVGEQTSMGPWLLV